MGKKGTKSTDGIGEIWDEPKSQKTTLHLTPTGKKAALERAKAMGISLSEVLERFGRETLNVSVELQKEVKEKQKLTVAEVMEALRHFSNYEIARIVLAAGTLLKTALKPSSAMKESEHPSIAALVIAEINKSSLSIEQIAEEVALPLERVVAISQGSYPSDEELIALTLLLTRDNGEPYRHDELIAIRQQSFNDNQDKHEADSSGCNCHS
ncbi:hypothetical protein WA1_49535 [Scytonema hofmannii PCC 7110]|uniref:Uncharacterized protein n=1 Tax=Scytonema hofmannii PCC 7110 TaxID=128403 RepID=A0A139WQT3_9CYAN|nr:hypothetical protein [Scytonema hofmannii]KYC34781.1 hypothetical protein WA1_49535 [Scytonema hofmannii PCC 7110]